MPNESQTVNHVINTFKNEFAPVAEKFVVNILVKEQWNSNDDYIWHPGVYVWYHKAEQRVIKVGRHLENARKRALQHINDDTHNDQYSIKALAGADQLTLILFSIINPAQYHWVAAVEIFLENTLQPAIKSKRQG